MCKKTKGLHNRIDKCMVNLIKSFQKLTGYETIACCCGHGKYPITIIVKSKLDNNPIEITTKTTIPRTKKFYKKDKQGYYYLPELKSSLKEKK